MSKYLKSRTNTPGSTVLPASFAPKAFEFSNPNFDLGADEPDYCQIVDTATEITTPRIIETRFDRIQNVYNNTNIAPAYQSGAKAGVRFICKVSDILTLLDDADSTYRVDLPVEAHVVVTLPLCDQITDEVIQQQVADAVATLFTSDGTITQSRIAKLVRGLTKPKMS